MPTRRSGLSGGGRGVWPVRTGYFEDIRQPRWLFPCFVSQGARGWLTCVLGLSWAAKMNGTQLLPEKERDREEELG